jgi:hypothetical protein
VFLALLWRDLGLPSPTKVQLDIAVKLQHGPRRRVICAFRGVGKSWITSAYVLWRLWCDPTVKILVVSASKDRSDAFSTFTKRLLREISFLRHLQPDVANDDRDANISFDVRGGGASHAPSVKSVGVYGQMTGSRADVIVFDDAEVPNNSETATQREKLLRRVLEGGAAVMSPGGEVIYLGTPQTEDSLYNKLPSHGYEITIWPARVPADASRYKGRLAPLVVKMVEEGAQAGTPIDPMRFDAMELNERELEYGALGFTLQYMLDTSLSDLDRYPLKLRDFLVMNVDGKIAPSKVAWGTSPKQVIEHLPMPGFEGDRWHRPMFQSEDFLPYELAFMFIDPSGRGKDETAYAIVKVLHGIAYLTAWGGYDDGYAAPTLAQLAVLARDHSVKSIVAEDNFGDGMWTALFRPVLQRIYPEGCRLEGVPSRGAKEERIIERLGPVLGAHRLVIDEAVIKADLRPKEHLGSDAVLKSGLYQLTRITRDRGCLKHDDRIEALAGAVHMAMQMIGRDTNKAASASKAEAFRKAIEKFHQGIFGKDAKKPAKTWSDRL